MSASATRSTRLTGPQRREQILDVTKALVGERGFHEISIDAVARRAGITRPVVYGHFDDLAGLLHALVDREGARAVGQLMEVLPRPEDGQPPGELLLGALRAFLEAVRADPVTWRLVLMPPEGTPAILRERATQIRGAVTEQLAAIAPQVLGERPGEPPPDPELTALTMQAVAEDAGRLLLERPDEFPIERLLVHARWLLDAFGLEGG